MNVKKIRINDRKAPRFRKTAGAYCVLSINLYKRYKLKYPETQITYQQFTKMILVYMETIGDTIIEDRDGFKLPNTLGSLMVGAFKPKKRTPINFKKSLEYGITVHDLNLETEGKVCKICYSNYSGRYKFINRNLWRFKACRNLSTKVSRAFKKHYTRYKEIITTQALSKLMS